MNMGHVSLGIFGIYSIEIYDMHCMYNCRLMTYIIIYYYISMKIMDYNHSYIPYGKLLGDMYCIIYIYLFECHMLHYYY